MSFIRFLDLPANFLQVAEKKFKTDDLSSLENQSKTPLNKRKGRLSFKKEDLKKFRERYIRQGKIKLSLIY